MFDGLELAPADPILGLEDAFRRDPNPAKINLAVGVFRDEGGRTPVLQSVKAAEELILRTETSKSYVGIGGTPEYAAAVLDLILGSQHPAVTGGLAATVHAPGGTGALRVAADLIHRLNPRASVWVTQPSWPNHTSVFEAAGLAVRRYPYYDPATHELAFDDMIGALRKAAPGDVIVIHGACHNPTGCDLEPGQWDRLGELVDSAGLLPLIDFAYQGFARGLREDAAGIARLASTGREMLIANSFSKNFGLYNERVGGLTLVATTPPACKAVVTHAKAVIRANYSNPPAHGANIVTTILTSPALRQQWQAELDAMRDRIWGMRRQFVAGLAALNGGKDFSFIERQHGMFSFTGLSKDQVRRLRQEHSIYIVDSGRINVAGLTAQNLPVVCRAIASVM